VGKGERQVTMQIYFRAGEIPLWPRHGDKETGKAIRGNWQSYANEDSFYFRSHSSGSIAAIRGAVYDGQ